MALGEFGINGGVATTCASEGYTGTKLLWCQNICEKGYTGATLDIHCGGTDHTRVHHTNEIAQSECANGQQFARYWVHNEFLKTESSGKMSKSSGEFLTLQVLVDRGFDAPDYRYFCATAHYRKFLTFSWENIAQARDAHRAFRRRVKPLLEAYAASRSAELDGQELSKAAGQ